MLYIPVEKEVSLVVPLDKVDELKQEWDPPIIRVEGEDVTFVWKRVGPKYELKKLMVYEGLQVKHKHIKARKVASIEEIPVFCKKYVRRGY